MKEWLGSVFNTILKFLKDNIPALAVALYHHLQNRLKRKENENKELQTQLDIEKEKEEQREKNRDVPDADYIDQFIDKDKGE